MQLSLQPQSSSDAFPSAAHEDLRLARRNRLICETTWLVRSLARELLTLHGFSISREDLESCGMRGLVHAADAFDYRPGTRFSTFAYYRIRGVMLDAVRDGFGMCTRTEISRMRELAELSGRETRRGREGSNGAPAHGDVEPLPILTMFRADYPDTKRTEAARELPPTPEDIVEGIVLIECVREAIASLPARARQVLELLYYEHEGSYEAVAQHLGMTRPHIFRIHARALRQLRSALAELAP